MFQWLFKYPIPVFTKGRFVLLGTWPGWLLPVLILLGAAALLVLIYIRRRDAAPILLTWRAGVIWGLQATTLALLLTLLWQPAMVVSELSSQQNIIAVIIDDSHSMGIADSDGKTREAAATRVLQDGILTGLQKRFQTRVYRLGSGLAQIDKPDAITPTATSTHIGAGLKKLAADTSDLPIGAVLLLSDGSENATGAGGTEINADALEALRNRRLPVHTIGFGREDQQHDIEIEDVSSAPDAVEKARVAVTVSLMQHGYRGQKAAITVRDGDKTIAQHDIELGPDGKIQTEPFFIPAGEAGAKSLAFSITPLSGEENLANNTVSRPLLVKGAKRRILYVEGEPRWEYKFIRRAEDQDVTVQVVSMLRTSENKIYRQGINDPAELSEGFPVRPEDLFQYAGIIIGSVDADYFTPLQRELMREYVDRRGGGILFLGGRSSLSDGGWSASSLNDVMPTFLPAGNHNFHRNAATVELTRAGADSPITRLLDDPEKNIERWKKLTYLADYEDPGTPKPGATVLADLKSGRRTLPLLITQNYGRGRSAILATGGTWRWQMSEALGDPSHDMFWQQLLRWLIADSPGPVTAATPTRLLIDDGHIQLTALVHDRQFQPSSDAHVTAHIVGPQNTNAFVDLTPSQDTPGQFQVEWTADKPGTYLAEVTAESPEKQPLGSDVLTFQREDGVAENFHTGQNRHLLEQLAQQTGGRYWKQSELKNLPRDISYSEAGISVRNTDELWNMPIVFLLLLALPAAEWLLRRKWGVV